MMVAGPLLLSLYWVAIPENAETFVLLNGPTSTTRGSPPAFQHARIIAFMAASVTVPCTELSTGACTRPDWKPEDEGEPPEPRVVTLLESHASTEAETRAEPAPPAVDPLFWVNWVSMSRLSSLPYLTS